MTTTPRSSSQPTAPARADAAAPIPYEGTVVAGRYRVEHLIGSGGMAVVVAAHDLRTEQRVALKCLSPAALEDLELAERFEREAQAFARIHSRHVARIFDVGKTQDGMPFIVLEYLEGHDLARYAARQQQLPVATILSWMLEACEGLAAAHAVNIVHRDIKPANLFRAKQPNETWCIKVLDFGISKLTDNPMTRTNQFLGTTSYMSPEQLQSARVVDHRSDLWSLGVVMYELLTGERPFSSGTPAELVSCILENPPLRLRELRPDIPVALETVVARCLQPNRDHRYQAASALADALQRILATEVPSDMAVPESRSALDVWPRPPSDSNQSSSPRAIPIVDRRPRTRGKASAEKTKRTRPKKAPTKAKRRSRRSSKTLSRFVWILIAIATVLAAATLVRHALVVRAAAKARVGAPSAR